MKLLGVKIHPLSLPALQERIQQSQRPLLIVTLNPEILLRAWKNLEYQRIINSAEIKIIDGVGIVIMAYLLYGIHLQRIAGADLASILIERAKNEGKRVLLVGGTATHNSAASNALGIQGLGGDFTWEDVYATIIKTKPAILLVSLGAPKQELFIHRLFTMYPQRYLPHIAMGIGGAVDFWANPSLRAPYITRRIGLEWAWRLLCQPWRYWRTIKATIVFPLTCVYEKFLVK